MSSEVESEIEGMDDPFDGEDMDDDEDDSGIPTWAVVNHVVHGRVAEGVKVTDAGKLVPATEVESSQPEPGDLAKAVSDVEAQELGRGKRTKKAPRKYNGAEFWQH